MTNEQLYELACWLIITPLSFIIGPNFVVTLNHLCDGTHEFSPEAKRLRKLRREYRYWKNLLACCDPEWDPEDYAYAAEKVRELRRKVEAEGNDR